jgi:hypothetical protein
MFCCPNVLKNEPCKCGPNFHSEPVQLSSIDHLKTFIDKVGQFEQAQKKAVFASSSSSNPVSSKPLRK